jgi:hypothetical protein
MPDEVILREKAREAIRSGKLPVSKPSRMFGGRGSEKPCALCGDIVPRGQPELEMEFTRDGSDPEAHRYLFHVRCFAAWELERTKVSTESL